MANTGLILVLYMMLTQPRGFPIFDYFADNAAGMLALGGLFAGFWFIDWIIRKPEAEEERPAYLVAIDIIGFFIGIICLGSGITLLLNGQNKTSDEHYFGELYYMVDEKNHVIDLTEKGRISMNPTDPEMFLLPDLGDEIAKIENDENISYEEKLVRKEEIHRLFNHRSEQLQNISQLLRAYSLYEKDDEYVVQDGDLIVIRHG